MSIKLGVSMEESYEMYDMLRVKKVEKLKW